MAKYVKTEEGYIDIEELQKSLYDAIICLNDSSSLVNISSNTINIRSGNMNLIKDKMLNNLPINVLIYVADKYNFIPHIILSLSYSLEDDAIIFKTKNFYYPDGYKNFRFSYYFSSSSWFYYGEN